MTTYSPYSPGRGPTPPFYDPTEPVYEPFDAQWAHRVHEANPFMPRPGRTTAFGGHGGFGGPPVPFPLTPMHEPLTPMHDPDWLEYGLRPLVQQAAKRTTHDSSVEEEHLQTNGDEARERALRALVGAAQMFDPSIRTRSDTPPPFPALSPTVLFEEASDVLLEAASDAVESIREQAMHVVALLAYNREVAGRLWDGARARDAIIAGAAAECNEGTRFWAHCALSLLVCHSSERAISVWSHAPARNVTLSTIWSGEPDLAPPRVRLEALDTLNNPLLRHWNTRIVPQLVTAVLQGFTTLMHATLPHRGYPCSLEAMACLRCKGRSASHLHSSEPRPHHCSEAVFDMQARNLWHEPSDVRAVVVGVLSDPAESQDVQVKVLGFLLNLLAPRRVAPASAVETVEFSWGQRQFVDTLLSCASSAEPSAMKMREGALAVLLCMLQCGKDDRRVDDTLHDTVTMVLLAAAEGRADDGAGAPALRPVLDRALRECCAAECDRLDMLNPAYAGQPLRLQPRYAALGLDARLAKLRAIWQRRASSMGSSRDLQIPVRVDSMCEDLLQHVDRLDKAQLASGMRSLSVKLDRGQDAGGLQRHAFSEFGKGLLVMVGVSPTAQALETARKLLKGFRPSVMAQPEQESELLRQLQAAISSASSSAGSSSISADDAERGAMLPPPKRQRNDGNDGSAPKLFKLTEKGSVAPSGAETLCKRVGKATADGQIIVPEVNAATIERYRAVGCVCALALANKLTLGITFARYFLRLVLDEPPTELNELQAEAEAEDPLLASHAALLQQPLDELNLTDCLTMSRQTTTQHYVAPLAPDPESVVTDADKEVWLRRKLEHQLVHTIAAQAHAFREGVCKVLGPHGLSLLSAAELQELWGGHAIDDERLAQWCAAADTSGIDAGLGELFWQWLQESSQEKRAQVLQFATGATRLPSEMHGWHFTIRSAGESYPTIQPTPDNGLAAPAMCARASTCSNSIYLPPYDDSEALRRGMEYSLMDGGFGNA